MIATKYAMRYYEITEKLLNEGLVKVPANLERSILHLINMNLLWMLRDKSGKDYPEHRRAVMACAKSLGEVLPKTKWSKPEDNFLVMKLPLDVSDLPANYTKLMPAHQSFFLVLDYGHFKVGDTVAYYWPRKNKKTGQIESVIVVNIEKLRGVKEFPSHRSHEEVSYIINVIAESIHHELQHMIQHVLLEPVDKKQTDMLPDYKKHKDDYYNSSVEYDPQIESNVADFVELWKMLDSYYKKGQIPQKPDLSKYIKQYVGMARSSINGVDASSFFLALRRHNQQRYKKAVKKFMISVIDRLHH